MPAVKLFRLGFFLHSGLKNQRKFQVIRRPSCKSKVTKLIMFLMQGNTFIYDVTHRFSDRFIQKQLHVFQSATHFLIKAEAASKRFNLTFEVNCFSQLLWSAFWRFHQASSHVCLMSNVHKGTDCKNLQSCSKAISLVSVAEQSGDKPLLNLSSEFHNLLTTAIEGSC